MTEIKTGGVNWGLVALGTLALALVLAVLSGRRLPLIGNDRLAFIVLLGIGLAMCAMGPLSTVASNGEWSSPIAMLGLLLGGLATMLAAAVLFGIRLPMIVDDRAAFLALAAVVALKVLAAGVYRLVIA